MIDAALTKLLDGPEPYVFVQPEDRRRWLSKRWVIKTHSHVEGTLLTLTERGEAVARSTQALKTALAVHPGILEALTNPTYGTEIDPGLSGPGKAATGGK